MQVPALSHPYINAFAYGLLYGPIALPCSGPLVVGIFALSLTAGEFFNQLFIFLWSGLWSPAPGAFVSVGRDPTMDHPPVCSPCPADKCNRRAAIDWYCHLRFLDQLGRPCSLPELRDLILL
jgi:hypothetical protein